MFLDGIGTFMKAIGPIISVGSQVAGAYGTISGQNQAYGGASNAMAYNASVYEQNADLIQKAAAQQKVVGEKKKTAYLSDIKATYGARGIDLSGSPLLLLAESAANLELDIQNEEFNSLIEVSKARSQAQIYGVEAKNYKLAQKTSTRNTALSTAYKIFSQY